MKTSYRGVNFISEFEGFEGKIYKDAAGLPTIGYGHLLKTGEEKRFSRGITKAEAIQLLKEDVRESEQAVSRLVEVNITQNEFDALVSFTFNVGQGNLRSSTLLRKLNENDKNEAADQFLRWNKAGGRVLNGLVRRREAERAMFLGV